MSDVTDRSMAVFKCPDCGITVSLSHPEGLSEAVLLCECNRNFPSMEHQRGHLERGEHD